MTANDDPWLLVQNPDRVKELWDAKEWEKLIPFADAVAAGVPKVLAATNPELFRNRRNGITELYCRALVFDRIELRRLAGLPYFKSKVMPPREEPNC